MFWNKDKKKKKVIVKSPFVRADVEIKYKDSFGKHQKSIAKRIDTRRWGPDDINDKFKMMYEDRYHITPFIAVSDRKLIPIKDVLEINLINVIGDYEEYEEYE